MGRDIVNWSVLRFLSRSLKYIGTRITHLNPLGGVDMPFG